MLVKQLMLINKEVSVFLKMISILIGPSIMKIYKYVFVIYLIGVISCQNPKPRQEIKSFYNIKIDYLYQGLNVINEDKYRNKISTDSIYLIFEGWFLDDTIAVEVGEKKNVYLISTESSTGIAKVIKFSNKENLIPINITLNSGPILTLENIPKFNIIGLNYSNNTLSAIYYKKVPRYD